jgi:hypothetical protein
VARRLDPAWVVLDSVENAQADRCVDLFRRPDGFWGFEAFRRDPEDRGAWTPVSFHSGIAFASRDAAWAAALRAVPGLTLDR